MKSSIQSHSNLVSLSAHYRSYAPRSPSPSLLHLVINSALSSLPCPLTSNGTADGSGYFACIALPLSLSLSLSCLPSPALLTGSAGSLQIIRSASKWAIYFPRPAGAVTSWGKPPARWSHDRNRSPTLQRQSPSLNALQTDRPSHSLSAQTENSQT